MRKHRNPPTNIYVNGNRLCAQEVQRVKLGFARYAARAAALFRDVDSPETATWANQIFDYDHRIARVLSRLEAQVGHRQKDNALQEVMDFLDTRAEAAAVCGDSDHADSIRELSTDISKRFEG